MAKNMLMLIQSSENAQTDDGRVSELQAMVAKYASNFSSRPSLLRPRPDYGDVVFVTGTTGGFGCNILAQLSRDDAVRKVYAFNRPSQGTILRQMQVIQKQGLLEDCLRKPKFELIEGDLTQPYFGLEPDVYETLLNSVTHIIHNGKYKGCCD